MICYKFNLIFHIRFLVLELVMQRHRQAMLRVTELSSLHALADQQMHNSIEAVSLIRCGFSGCAVNEKTAALL
jgi:hypothetical protein